MHENLNKKSISNIGQWRIRVSEGKRISVQIALNFISISKFWQDEINIPMIMVKYFKLKLT